MLEAVNRGNEAARFKSAQKRGMADQAVASSSARELHGDREAGKSPVISSSDSHDASIALLQRCITAEVNPENQNETATPRVQLRSNTEPCLHRPFVPRLRNQESIALVLYRRTEKVPKDPKVASTPPTTSQKRSRATTEADSDLYPKEERSSLDAVIYDHTEEPSRLLKIPKKEANDDDSVYISTPRFQACAESVVDESTVGVDEESHGLAETESLLRPSSAVPMVPDVEDDFFDVPEASTSLFEGQMDIDVNEAYDEVKQTSSIGEDHDTMSTNESELGQVDLRPESAPPEMKSKPYDSGSFIYYPRPKFASVAAQQQQAHSPNEQEPLDDDGAREVSTEKAGGHSQQSRPERGDSRSPPSTLGRSSSAALASDRYTRNHMDLPQDERIPEANSKWQTSDLQPLQRAASHDLGSSFTAHATSGSAQPSEQQRLADEHKSDIPAESKAHNDGILSSAGVRQSLTDTSMDLDFVVNSSLPPTSPVAQNIQSVAATTDRVAAAKETERSGPRAHPASSSPGPVPSRAKLEKKLNIRFTDSAQRRHFVTIGLHATVQELFDKVQERLNRRLKNQQVQLLGLALYDQGMKVESYGLEQGDADTWDNLVEDAARIDSGKIRVDAEVET